MIDENIVFPTVSESNPGFSRFEPILTVATLKIRFLHGINFTDSNGVMLSDDAFEDAILAAMSDFEHAFDLTLTPTTYTDKKDYEISDYNNWCFVQLNHRPIIEVISFKLKFVAHQELISFPLDWMRVYNAGGQIQLTPTAGALGSFNIGGASMLPKVFGIAQRYPQLYEIIYKAGFEQDKIPRIVNQWIGLTAANYMLPVAGNIILGNGTTSESISFDGMSQSTSKAINAGTNIYKGTIDQNTQRLEKITENIMNYYVGINSMIA